jgi:hypothetical protein
VDGHTVRQRLSPVWDRDFLERCGAALLSYVVHLAALLAVAKHNVEVRKAGTGTPQASFAMTEKITGNDKLGHFAVIRDCVGDDGKRWYLVQNWWEGSELFEVTSEWLEASRAKFMAFEVSPKGEPTEKESIVQRAMGGG